VVYQLRLSRYDWVDQDTGMQAGQDTGPGGPYGDGCITRSPAAGVAAARL